MVKAKRRQLAALAASKETLSADEESWVLVKKQKITILIPPLPVQPASQSPRMKRVQTKTRKLVKGRSQISSKRHCKISWTKQNKTTIHGFKDEIQCVGDGTKVMNPSIQAPPNLTNERLPLSSAKAAHDGLDFVSEFTELPSQPSLDLVPSAIDAPFTNNQHIRRTYKSSGTLAGASQQHAVVLEALKSLAASKGRDLPLQVNGMRDVHSFTSASCLNIGALQNQRIRALNVEKKLRKAGGLSMWLISQGLGQFIQMFQREKIGKLQLLNLTMGKLKDMGANAVGPRRKLMHAIDCLCQPCYF
ncbi:hypothetical protein AAC387_Pa09g1797 [Persea americana]